MNYDFSFDKKNIILIASGCIAIGILLFLAGFIVGFDKGSGPTEVAAKEPSPRTRVATNSPMQDIEHPATKTLQKPSPEKNAETASPSSLGGGKISTFESKQAGEGPPKGKEEETKGQPAFSLQLGAFQTEDNALKLKELLKSKGYPVFMFRVLDAEGHIWHTVRMGHYPDMKKASEAAASFNSKEQMAAWIRPSNAF